MREALPGADLVEEGLADLTAGRVTAAALLVSIGAPRLRRLGIRVPAEEAEPERRLYELLEGEGRGAHSRFNALVRRLVSFERTLEQRRGTARRIRTGRGS